MLIVFLNRKAFLSKTKNSHVFLHSSALSLKTTSFKKAIKKPTAPKGSVGQKGENENSPKATLKIHNCLC